MQQLLPVGRGRRRAAHRGKADAELCSWRRWMSQGSSPTRPGAAVRPLREPVNSQNRPVAVFHFRELLAVKRSFETRLELRCCAFKHRLRSMKRGAEED